MMMNHLNWRLSSFWIPGREGSASCKYWKYRSQRSYACRPCIHYCVMLTNQRAFRIRMGSKTHCCLQRWPWPSYNVRGNIDLLRSLRYQPQLFFPLTLVGARVQAPYPLVFNSLSIMELLRVYSTERSWYGYWPQFAQLIKDLFHRNPAPPAIFKTLRLNNLCSINLWPTLNALVLPTWLPACVLFHSISWWRLSINPPTFSPTQVSDLDGNLVWMATWSFATHRFLF